MKKIICNCNKNCVGKYAPVNNYLHSSDEAIPKWIKENEIDIHRVKVRYEETENIDVENIISCQSQRYFLMKNGDILANRPNLVSYFRQVTQDEANVKKLISEFKHKQNLLAIEYICLIEQTVENCKSHYEDKKEIINIVKPYEGKPYVKVFYTYLPKNLSDIILERSK